MPAIWEAGTVWPSSMARPSPKTAGSSGGVPVSGRLEEWILRSSTSCWVWGVHVQLQHKGQAMWGQCKGWAVWDTGSRRYSRKAIACLLLRITGLSELELFAQTHHGPLTGPRNLWSCHLPFWLRDNFLVLFLLSTQFYFFISFLPFV